MEEDFAIFDTILAPLCKAILLVTCAGVLHIFNITDDDDPIQKVAKQSHINKLIWHSIDF